MLRSSLFFIAIFSTGTAAANPTELVTQTEIAIEQTTLLLTDGVFAWSNGENIASVHAKYFAPFQSTKNKLDELQIHKSDLWSCGYVFDRIELMADAIVRVETGAIAFDQFKSEWSVLIEEAETNLPYCEADFNAARRN